MTKVFISYRRQDSRPITERLHDHLEDSFGEGNVFIDVDDIPAGADFPPYLDSQINDCDVALIIIGTEWSRMINEQVTNPKDFVRIEVEKTLSMKDQRGILVIPILVNDASMPNHLPPSVSRLMELNAFKIRPNPDFKADCKALIKQIRHQLTTPKEKLRSAKFTLPMLEWMPITAGKTYLREDKKTQTRRKTLRVDRFEMAKYPVTVAQYDAFISDGGYEYPKWWEDSEEYSYNEPKELPSFSGANHPRVNVSLHEALAFCRWLSDRTGDNITLPTEAQWQLAAHGADEKQSYPWGDNWDSSRCNYDKNHNGTTSVLHHEGKDGGESPFGIVDMAGNVYEWTLTRYKYESDSSIIKSYALKGGAWDDGVANDMHIRYRIIFPDVMSTEYIGFRCIRLPK